MKYLKLVEFGFLSLDELQADIRRYPRYEARRLVDTISRDLRQEVSANRRNLYVVKLVSTDLYRQLPNFRIETESELNQLPAFLHTRDISQFVEVWFCRTRIDKDIFSVAGRFRFTRKDSFESQLVEQVWRSSPRVLEDRIRTLPCPYVRASRSDWGWPYRIEEMHSPPGEPMTPETLTTEFHRSLRIFEEAREKVEFFLSYLDSFGFVSYSLEYKIVGSRLMIIDWDTPDDRKVLA